MDISPIRVAYVLVITILISSKYTCFAKSSSAHPVTPLYNKSDTTIPPQNQESRLLEDLIRNYNRHARPIANVFDAINVSISFYITKILGLDEKNQVLTTFGWLEVLWKDDYLVWNPEDYGGVKRIIIPPNMLWLPDFGLENSAESIYDEHADKKFRAGVDNDGSIQWVPGGKYTTSCQLDISLYPFDSQVCGMDFVDWTYDGRFVNLLNSSSHVGLDVYKTHGEWDITGTQALRSDQYFHSDPGIPFPTVRFVLYLQRKPRYYLINVMTPCILMSMLAIVVFYLPPDSGEKVSLGITVLLSFSVFLLLVAENVPKTSEDVPLIGIYLTMVMAMAAVSIAASVVVLDLHHHDSTRQVPTFLALFVFGTLSKVLGIFNPYGYECDRLYEVIKARSVRNSYDAMNGNDSENKNYNPTGSMSAGVGVGGGPGITVGSGCSVYDELEALVNSTSGSSSARRTVPVIDEILLHLRAITRKLHRNAKRDQTRHEWKMLAKVVDRSLMVIFIVIIVTLSTCILWLIPRLYGAKRPVATVH